MEKVKTRIDPITRKEAIQRDERMIDFLCQNDRLAETPEAWKYRNPLIEVKQSINTITRMNLA